jgi:hypothetical protein
MLLGTKGQHDSSRKILQDIRKSCHEEYIKKLMNNKQAKADQKVNIELTSRQVFLSKKLNNIEMRQNRKKRDRSRMSSRNSEMSDRK